MESRQQRWGIARAAAIPGLLVLAAGGLLAEDAGLLHTTGDLRGALRVAGNLPVYDANPEHPWNRLFTALYTRPSHLPARPDGPPVARREGGDVLEFLAWGRTTYWSSPEVVEKLVQLLDRFLDGREERLIRDPLHRVWLQQDLWAAHDYLVTQNLFQFGDRPAARRRQRLAGLLAKAIRALALPRAELEKLPDNYAAALRSGAFVPEHDWDRTRSYLPPALLADPEQWLEVDFHQPNLHEDIEGRFITLHTRHFRGRSYFRVFYRYPGGRTALDEYLQYVDREGLDWKFGAQNGFLRLKPGLRQIPAGTEVALLQFLIALDEQLQPVPTRMVQSVRLRTFKNADGAPDPMTDSGKGMNVYEYVLRRRLCFDGLRHGGLEREPNDLPQYRLVFQGPKAPDWGPRGRQETVGSQCVSCHTGQGPGTYSLVTLTNQGGFDAGAMLGVAHVLLPGKPSPRGPRAVRWKLRDETYRR
ncbi:MAG: hypothetical protein FJX77_10705, partial [Armatimonadetes bacterium]|nr:hypothetical protein [Armatimonadota bacterium]